MGFELAFIPGTGIVLLNHHIHIVINFHFTGRHIFLDRFGDRHANSAGDQDCPAFQSKAAHSALTPQ
jgi:hypothetical protein